MFASTLKRYVNDLRASYNILLLITESGQVRTIGEQVILSVVEKVLKTILQKPAYDIFEFFMQQNSSKTYRRNES